MDARIRDFAKSILHGDKAHRDWLMAAAEAFIAGKRVPKPPKPKQQPKPHRIRDLRHALD